MDKQQLKIKEPGLWEIQDGSLAFPSFLTLFLFDGLKALPGYNRKLILKSIKKNKHTRIVEKILKIKNQERELLYELSKHGTKTFCVNAMILVNELVGECNKME